MSVTAADFNTFAESLKESDQEIDSRNYISRSYYAAFLTARSYAGTLPPVIGSGFSHEQVLQTLSRQLNSNPQALKLRSLSALLGVVRANRNRADYDIDDDVDQSHVQKHAKDLENFWKKFEEIT